MRRLRDLMIWKRRRSKLGFIFIGITFLSLLLVMLIVPNEDIHEDQVEDIIIPINNSSKCKPCGFNPVIRPNSTERDIILTQVTKYGPNVERLIRSIRSTGCKATIAVFTLNGLELPESLFDCDIIQVEASHWTTRVKRSPYKVRWEWYYKFLTENNESYDRVMHTDGFDAAFFGDPFALANGYNSLYFQMEDRPIDFCPYNKRWISTCHSISDVEGILNQTIACSGSLIGGVNQFLKFTELLVNHVEWPRCWGKGFDQGDFNYVLYALLNFTEVNAKFMDCNSGFMTYNYCAKRKKLFNSRHQLCTPNGKRPLIYAHQYNRYNASKDFIRKICEV